MTGLAAGMLALLLLSAPARAEGNAVADRVDKELAQPALNEASKAAKDLGNPDQTAAQPTWGAWARMPQTPGVRKLLRFFDDELVQPIFKSANASGAARALASADPNATAVQGAAPQQDALMDKMLKLLGLGTANPLSLDLAPNQVVAKKVAAPGDLPHEVRPDSLKFVKGRARAKGPAAP